MSKDLTLLSVIGRDRPGIIAAVTGALAASRANLEDISMTVLEGELAMMLITQVPKGSRKGVEKKLQAVAKTMKLTLFWKDLSGPHRRGAAKSGRMMVTVIGRDRTGIVHQVSRELAKFGLNISGLESRIIGEGAKTIYSMILEVETGRTFKDLPKVEAALARLGKSLKLEIALKPVEEVAF